MTAPPPCALRTKVQYPVAVIGDVHGQFGLLDGLLARLDREAPDHTIVFLGDFVDRGPSSKYVLDRVVHLVENGRATAVMGNHDLALVRAAGLDGRPPSAFWGPRYRDLYDSAPTFASYLNRRTRAADFFEDLKELAAAMPAAHKEFLAGLPWLVSTPALGDVGGTPLGGHLFLHAGLSRHLNMTATQQVGALVRKVWDTWMAKDLAPFTPHPEYPPWLGADRTACANPLPLHDWIQVTGHETVPVPVYAGPWCSAIQIDTSGGQYEPLTACLLADPVNARFLCYPDAPAARRR